MKKLLLRGSTSIKFTMVDDDDFERFSEFKWYVSKTCKYAWRNNWRNGKNRKILLHKAILDDTTSQVDHINRNKLDNRKANLRPCTAASNSQNRKRDLKYKSSRFHGVHRRSDGTSWCASIRVDGVLKHIGSFKEETDAARAYDAKARKYFKEFAIINLP